MSKCERNIKKRHIFFFYREVFLFFSFSFSCRPEPNSNSVFKRYDKTDFFCNGTGNGFKEKTRFCQVDNKHALSDPECTEKKIAKCAESSTFCSAISKSAKTLSSKHSNVFKAKPTLIMQMLEFSKIQNRIFM